MVGEGTPKREQRILEAADDVKAKIVARAKWLAAGRGAIVIRISGLDDDDGKVRIELEAKA